jgi:hypothetical protein
MAGIGPAPKPANSRARRNKDAVAQTVLRQETVEAPELPKKYQRDEEVARWWNTWVNSPQAELFSSTDWQGLLDCLPLVNAYYNEEGGLRYAGEIRMRVAAYGATPADRARLRMTFAQADEADRKRQPATPTSQARYSGLKVVDDN